LTSAGASNSGNLTFTGTGNRITGDFSNATLASRLMFQNSVVNGPSNVQTLPNGTGTTAGFLAFANSDPANTNFAQIAAVGLEARVSSGITGTGTYAPMTFLTSGTEKLRIAADTTGTYTFGGTAPRITGDFSNATIANRVAFQSSTVNGATRIPVIPNGTSNASAIAVLNNSDANNASWLQLSTSATETLVASTISGTGTYLPMTFYTSGSERLRIDTSGNVGIGTSSPIAPLTVASVLRVGAGNPSVVLQGETNTERIAIRSAESTPGGGNGTAVFVVQGARGTIASPTATISGDALGYYQFGGYTGTAWTRGAWVAGFADGNWSGTNQGSNLTFSTTPNGSTAIAERMRIDSAGNVGIGTSTPKTDVGLSLHLYNSANTGTVASNTYLLIESSTRNAVLELSGAATAACAVAFSDTPGTQVAGIGSTVSDQNLFFRTGGTTERMRIDSSGNVGIGTSSTTTVAKLRVLQGANQVAFLSEGANTPGYPQFGFSGQTADNGGRGTGMYLVGDSVLGWSTSGSERMRIDSSGNLLVGTTSSSPNPGLFVSASGAMAIGNNAQASGWGFVNFLRSGTAIGSITQNGTTAVLYNVTSDQRLKENIQDADSASDLIDAIQVRQYTWKSDASHQRYGFIAQELVTVAPDAVHQPADPDEMMAVDYSKLVPMLVKEIQSLRARVAALESN
jgi:hypothetical protein